MAKLNQIIAVEKGVKSKVYSELTDLNKILAKIPEEVYMGMFGDHVKITATREGFQVDEYDHE